MRALEWLAKATAFVAALGVFIIASVTAADVIARYFLHAPLLWAGDTSRYILSGGVFLALPEVTRRAKHPFMSLAIEAMPPATRRIYRKALLVVAALACIIVAYFAIGLIIDQLARGTLTPGIVQIQRWILTAALIYGFTLTAIFLIKQTFEDRSL